jgi:GNAT superfamily N-acetyltransferase
MTESNNSDRVDPADVTLSEAFLGYNILYQGDYVGAIEGIPGRIEYIEVEPHWQNRGIARVALKKFVAHSLEEGESEVTTNDTMTPVMDHILETEGFEEQTDDIGWVKELD